MRMFSLLSVLSVGALLVGCGKNDPVTPKLTPLTYDNTLLDHYGLKPEPAPSDLFAKGKSAENRRALGIELERAKGAAVKMSMTCTWRC